MKQNYILCPVCKKHKFPSWEDNGTCICPSCGWGHDTIGEEKTDTIIGPNDLSLNDYKLRYEYYVNQNAKYYWSYDHYPEIPQIEAMDCPVCKKMKFEPLSWDAIFCDVTPGDVHCVFCGWKYDIKQTESPNLKKQTNEMSLNEYRKWYDEKISVNPDYIFFEEETDKYVPTPHMCPVCEKYEFKDESSYDICPYCGWEDDGLMEAEPDLWAGCANDLCLNDFRKRYDELVTKNPKYKYSINHFGEE